MNYNGNILAYMAGIIDGDGSISFIKRKSKGSPLYFPMVQLANKNPELIDIFIHHFGGRKFIRTKLSKHSKFVSYAWKIEKKNSCIPFLTSIIPYLIIKKERARLILDFCENHTFKRGASKLGANELLKRERLYIKIRDLNKNPNLKELLKGALSMREDLDFWSYVAGLMDTDGSFSLKREFRKSGGGKSPVYTPHILLSQYDCRAIYFIYSNFPLANLMVISSKSVQSGFCYRFSISSKKNAIVFLNKIIPFLILKKDQASTLLDYCLSVKSFNGSILSSAEIELRDTYYHKIVNLNKYGVFKPSLIDLEARRGDRAEAKAP